MSEASIPPQWEYRVIHINVDNRTPPQPPDPEVASQKLGGTLSPEFISREFPQQYGPEQRAQSAPKHVLLQAARARGCHTGGADAGADSGAGRSPAPEPVG